jgi:ligand-binding SRPBCC domain-containing protein
MIEISRIQGSRNYRLKCDVRVPAPIEEVFAFFADATQLERLTPDWLHFAVLTPTPIRMRAGTLIDYKLRVHGIPMRWRSRIGLWEPPHRFADEQLRGPYRHWYHMHSFEEDGDQTICRDEVEYSVIGGSLIHSLFVKRDLRRIFAYRSQVLIDIFGHGRTEPSADIMASGAIL